MPPPRASAPTVTTPGPEVAALRGALRAARGSLARDLPWVGCRDPWSVLVAEVMLQQTSTGRVVQHWEPFLRRFATPAACAAAPQSEVVAQWVGLGFNRRAQSLHRAAMVIEQSHGGCVPSTVDELVALPGLGPYSARAVASFAFGRAVGVVDTNAGRVLARAVANARLAPPAAQALADRLVAGVASAPVNQSLLDLGAQFCRARPRCEDCPARSACRWRRAGGPDPARNSAGVTQAQAPFAGSGREMRGALVRALRDGPRSRRALRARVGAPDGRFEAALVALEREGLIEVAGRQIRLRA